ncbi:MAG TPA: hypothetical protein ENN13_03735 [Candidatus Altiarchaeales archaeon]|nr:hypothetical protein [Candidatus Altiarchaeales archaeon]
MKTAYTLLALTILSATTVAWGPVAHKYLCEEAVKNVWGGEAIEECITNPPSDFLLRLCEAAREVSGDEYYETCKSTIFQNANVHPSMVPAEIFGDEILHKNYDSCPIKDPSKKTYYCGSRGDGKAPELAQKWFDQMDEAEGKCMRVWMFCVASHYYADAQSPLRQLDDSTIQNDCVNVIEKQADRQIQNQGLAGWSVGTTCEFSRGKKFEDYKQRFGLSASTAQGILNLLEKTALDKKDAPYRAENRVVVLANNIDHDLATGFYNILRENGNTLEFIDASQFQEKKYAEKIIILGGHGAPAGVGLIVSDLISKTTRDNLETPGAKIFEEKEGVWTLNQKILLIAGYSKDDTQKSWMQNQDEILATLS